MDTTTTDPTAPADDGVLRDDEGHPIGFDRVSWLMDAVFDIGVNGRTAAGWSEMWPHPDAAVARHTSSLMLDRLRAKYAAVRGQWRVARDGLPDEQVHAWADTVAGELVEGRSAEEMHRLGWSLDLRRMVMVPPDRHDPTDDHQFPGSHEQNLGELTDAAVRARLRAGVRTLLRFVEQCADNVAGEPARTTDPTPTTGSVTMTTTPTAETPAAEDALPLAARTTPDEDAIAHWCEMVNEERDSELTAEAIREVTGCPIASAALRAAGELYADEPEALTVGHSLGEIDYVWIVVGAIRAELFYADTPVEDLREGLVGVEATEWQAAHAAMAHCGGTYPDDIRPDQTRLSEEDIDDLRKVAMNTAPAVEFFETSDGAWMVYSHRG